MAVCGERERILRRQQQVAAFVERGHHALREEADEPGVVVEVAVVFEERAGGGVVGVAGHDIPRDRLTHGPAGGEQLLGKDLEQRLLLDRRHGVFALGPFVPQPRALPAGDQERRDLSRLEKFFAAGGGLSVLVVGRRIRISLHRLDIAGQFDLGLVLHVPVDQARQGGQIQCRQLAVEPGFLGFIELVVEPQRGSRPAPGRRPLRSP